MSREELLNKIDDINRQFHKELELIFLTKDPRDPEGRLVELPADRAATLGDLKNSVMILWNNTVQLVKTTVYERPGL